jgi:hypothetical protein
MEEWYAVAQSPLSSDVITITAAHSTSEIQDIEFGVSGANTQSPFDPSGSLPCIAIGYSYTPECTLSTESSATMVVMGVADPNGAEPNPGYSLILYSAERVQDMSSEYQTFSSPQSGINVGFTAAWDTDIANGNDTWVVIGDAIQAASQPSDTVVRMNQIYSALTGTLPLNFESGHLKAIPLNSVFSTSVSYLVRELDRLTTLVKINLITPDKVTLVVLSRINRFVRESLS